MKLLCAISNHGLGHLAQTAPVLNAMGALHPGVEWLLWSGLPTSVLKERVRIDFAHRHEPADMGLLMLDALRVDRDGSQAAYLRFHDDWRGRVRREAAWMHQERVQGVLSNAAYLPLAAAAQAGIGSVGFCSLNWLDIARSYLHGLTGMEQVFVDMDRSYQSARSFLRLEPGMPMAWMSNLESAEPVAATGQNRRLELEANLGLREPRKLVLLGFGGVAYQHALALPRLDGVAWLVPDAWPDRAREDMHTFRRSGLPFHDLLASCDTLLTKVGYGSFVEAAGLGIPVLYLDRPDWPETPWLASWLHRHGRAAAIDEARLFSPSVQEDLETLWLAPAPEPPDIAGAPAVARRIGKVLGL